MENYEFWILIHLQCSEILENAKKTFKNSEKPQIPSLSFRFNIPTSDKYFLIHSGRNMLRIKQEKFELIDKIFTLILCVAEREFWERMEWEVFCFFLFIALLIYLERLWEFI